MLDRLPRRYLALASDFDGTLADEEFVSERVVSALRRFRGSERRLILVTGRELVDLRKILPQVELFDYIVAENGATIYDPRERREDTLAQRPSEDFIHALIARGVTPLSAGKVILATHLPHERAVVETIRDFGLELPGDLQ